MFGELLRSFARENFGDDKYSPVLYGETKTTKPLALVSKRPRSIWKRPFSRQEIILLDELQKYVVRENKEAYLEAVKSNIIQEEVFEKGKATPASR